jgi:ADP-ribosyl-[dinitrogen reductase] hydrolase
MTLRNDRLRGCLLGLAVGDAVGTTVEFRPRGSFSPITDLTGGGPFGLKPGEWTDDTSMALCLAASLVAWGGFDAQDQMDRYLRWYEQGYLSSTGRCFDIGNTVRQALLRYQQTGDPFSGSADPRSAGNGSIMRLAPLVLFFYPDAEAIWRYAAESSRTTHAAAECLDACRLLGDILCRALSGAGKADCLFATPPDRLASAAIQTIARGAYRGKAAQQITGSGYVVASLEAALWCFWTTDSYETAILAAANLGDDADTTAAICGQVAGAFYGETGIPARWLEKLVMREEIARFAEQLTQRHKDAKAQSFS